MTLENTTVQEIFDGDGSTVTFAIPFDLLVFEQGIDEVEVWIRDAAGNETLQVKGGAEDYTLSGDPPENVVFNSAPANTVKVLIRRVVPKTQNKTYIQTGPFPAKTHENGLDIVTGLIQQLGEKLKRTIQFGNFSTEEDIKMGDLVANGIPQANADADEIEWKDPSDVLSTSWGQIEGTLSNQTDLQSALNDKADDSDLTAHTGDTANPHNTAMSNLTDNTLSGELDANGNDISDLKDVTFQTGSAGGTMRTGTSNADKWELQAFEVGTGYQTVARATADTDTPTFELFTERLRIKNDIGGESAHLNADSLTVDRVFTFPDKAGTFAMDGDLQTHISDTTNPHSTAMSNLSDYDAATNQIINVVDPTADQHAATKKYVDDSTPGTKNSIEVDATDLQLVGDEAAPGNNRVYGTDASGTKGWQLSAGGAYVVEGTEASPKTATSATLTHEDEQRMLQLLTTSGHVTLGGTPIIANGSVTGQELSLLYVGTGDNSLTIPSSGNIRIKGGQITLTENSSVLFAWSGSFWRCLSFNV